MTEGEMVGWYHRLNGHEFEQAPGVGEGQGSLACCSSQGLKESNMTERLNNNKRGAVGVSLDSNLFFFPLSSTLILLKLMPSDYFIINKRCQLLNISKQLSIADYLKHSLHSLQFQHLSRSSPSSLLVTSPDNSVLSDFPITLFLHLFLFSISETPRVISLPLLTPIILSLSKTLF